MRSLKRIECRLPHQIRRSEKPVFSSQWTKRKGGKKQGRKAVLPFSLIPYFSVNTTLLTSLVNSKTCFLDSSM
ncbi:mCG147315 [Mus musculus]|nr:mCG147315 [Mus musculus]